jgi:hypothetical protein
MNEPRQWKDAYAQAADGAHDCLPPEELLAALAGTLDAARAERAVQALAECPRCAAVAQIAQDLQANLAADAQAFAALGFGDGVGLADTTDSANATNAVKATSKEHASNAPDAIAARRTVERGRAGTQRGLPRWAFAAAAVLVVGLGTVLLLPREPAPLVVRGSAVTAVDPASGSALHAAPAQLGWSPIGSASAYRVELYDERAESLWRSERVTATRVVLPDELRARLARGTFLWRVRAEGSDIEIGPFYFRVEP